MSKFGVTVSVLLTLAVALCGCGDLSQLPAGEPEHIRIEQDQPQGGTQTTGQITDQNPDQTSDAYIPPQMKGEITISCFDEAEFIRVAAEQFMKAYPDVRIVINSYQGEYGVNAVENYLTNLNTKIMTGKAEDILFTSYLPLTKYSEMGVFEDLNAYVSAMPEFNEDNFFLNVLYAAREESGELYVIPYLARFPTIEFNGNLLSGHTDYEKELSDLQSYCFSEAMDIARQLVEEAYTDKENVFLTQSSAVSFADRLIKDSLRQFIDTDRKAVNMDTPEYIELLKSVQGLAEKGYFDSDIDFYNVEYYFAATIDYDVQAAFYGLDEDTGNLYCMPMSDSEGKVSISANACVALNSASDNKALAWEFIRYLLSEEVQTLPSIFGAAVNRKGFDAAAERYYSLYSEGNKNAHVEKKAYHDLLELWMNQINDCDTLDPAVMWMVDEENNKYFTGQQTAEATARNLQRLLEQYFNE